MAGENEMSKTRRQLGAAERLTFRVILEETRLACAQRAWDRAKRASLFRKMVVARGCCGARLLSRIKTAAARRAFELAPECVTIGLDDDFQIGLPSIRWHGSGRLHLAGATDINRWVLHRVVQLQLLGINGRTGCRTA
jgi:hypothetical protein